MTINYYLNESLASTSIMLYIREFNAGRLCVKVSTKIHIDKSDWDKVEQKHSDPKINNRLSELKERAQKICNAVMGSGAFNTIAIRKYIKKYLFNTDEIKLINIRAGKKGCVENAVYIVNEPDTDNYKIGCCSLNNYKARQQQLNTGRSKPLIPVALYKIPSGLFHSARNIENFFMHDFLKDKRITKHERDYKSEWFNLHHLELGDIDDIIIRFFRGIPEDYMSVQNFIGEKAWVKFRKTNQVAA